MIVVIAQRNGFEPSNCPARTPAEGSATVPKSANAETAAALLIFDAMATPYLWALLGRRGPSPATACGARTSTRRDARRLIARCSRAPADRRRTRGCSWPAAGWPAPAAGTPRPDTAGSARCASSCRTPRRPQPPPRRPCPRRRRSRRRPRRPPRRARLHGPRRRPAAAEAAGPARPPGYSHSAAAPSRDTRPDPAVAAAGSDLSVDTRRLAGRAPCPSGARRRGRRSPPRRAHSLAVASSSQLLSLWARLRRRGPSPRDGLRRALPRLSRHALGGGAFVQDHDLDAPVLLTARRGVVRDDRVLRPVALGGDPVGGDAP